MTTWQATNGRKIRNFPTWIGMMTFLYGGKGDGWWAL